MSRVAYVQCAAGVAGDMLLGALIDAGADRDAVAGAIAGLGVDGYALTFERVQRGGIAATWANVAIDHLDHNVVTNHHHNNHNNDGDGDHQDHDGSNDDDAGPHHHEHRPAREIREVLAAADLADPVRRRAQTVFDVLADAEGAVHDIDPGDVEFHEVGALDAIVDVVGIAAALQSLGIERLVAGPIATGHGTIRAAHGSLPNPSPAVARLFALRAIPTIGIDTGMELATPTGVATLAALAESFGAMPSMTVQAVGYGAGTADPPGRPNVVQIVIGETVDAESSVPFPGRPAVQLDVNVDDVTGEVLAHTIASLVDAGAHDAWVTPIVMKKGRPAHMVSAVCDPVFVDGVADVLLAETGSLGIRATAVQRWPQTRAESIVAVEGHPIAVKLAAGRVKVEHDDALAAATALGRPLRTVIAEAERLGNEIRRDHPFGVTGPMS